MTPNPLIILAAAFVPFVLAFVWYNKSLFGGDNWTRIAGLSVEQALKPVKPLQMLLSVVFNFFIAGGIYGLCVHQGGVFSLVGGDPELLKTGTAAAFLAEYGSNFLTFKHGVFHGLIGAFMFVFPILGYATIFERKSMKYLMVNFGFWAISFMLMGGVICQWGTVPV